MRIDCGGCLESLGDPLFPRACRRSCTQMNGIQLWMPWKLPWRRTWTRHFLICTDSYLCDFLESHFLDEQVKLLYLTNFCRLANSQDGWGWVSLWKAHLQACLEASGAQQSLRGPSAFPWAQSLCVTLSAATRQHFNHLVAFSQALGSNENNKDFYSRKNIIKRWLFQNHLKKFVGIQIQVHLLRIPNILIPLGWGKSWKSTLFLCILGYSNLIHFSNRFFSAVNTEVWSPNHLHLVTQGNC